MNELFKEYGIELNEFQQKKFSEFLQIFIQKNSLINLSAIRDEKNIILKHFIDSVIILKHQKIEWNILDLWTGWGFPWIPLSIMSQENNSNFLLVDSIAKKVKVVNEFCETLWLNNIKAITARAEELWINPEFRWKFDFVVSRAMAYLPTLLEYSIPMLKIGWIFISYKIDNPEELVEAQKAFKEFKCEVIDKINYQIDWQERVFLIIKKTWETHKKYPRKIWDPLKFPIK